MTRWTAVLVLGIALGYVLGTLSHLGCDVVTDVEVSVIGDTGVYDG